MAAEQAAHHHNLNPTEDSEQNRLPDIFSIAAHESLIETFQPAFRHLIRVLASRYPSHLGWFYRNCDEVYLAIHTIIEYSSLHTLCGSFSERFYGMKRVTVDGKPWTLQQKLLNLLLLVGIPYIRHKLQAFYNAKSVEVADGKWQGNDTQSKAYRAVVYMYPYMHASWTALVASYFIRFLLGHSDVHSPVLRLSGVKLVPLSLSDMMEEPSLPWSDITKHYFLTDKVKFLMHKLLSSAPLLIYHAFSSGVFFLQFLQWYSTYTQTDGERETITVASAISPPKLPECTEGSKLTCPVCKKTRTNSTVLSTSGYVFCYPCIYKYVHKHGKCPVTSFPSTTEHLTKIYMPDT